MSWKIPVKDQVKVQIEMSNYCNAACPACARAKVHKDTKDEMYPVTLNDRYISLDEFKSWFDKDVWSSLTHIHMCGNYDEATTNPDLIEIVEWILSSNRLFPMKPKISIATNGGTRNEEFWQKLGKISSESNNRLSVTWGIDGFEDTNHLYRINVAWDRVQANYRTYIANGGEAVWQFIYFSHNEHQAHLVQDYATSEGFIKVKFIGSARPDIGKTEHAIDKNATPKIVSSVIAPKCLTSSINDHGIYITHQGYVLPCCWWGTKLGLENLKDYSDLYSPDQHKLNGTNSIQDIFDSNWYSNLFTAIMKETFSKCIANCKQNKVATQRFEDLNDK
jgi:hypothetical protein